MFRIAVVGVAGIFISSFPAFALCTSYPNTLTNGTTADAGQVMANFNCAVLTSGATIGGATLTGTTTFPGATAVSSSGAVGIGMSPINILDITQNQNSSSVLQLLNNSTGNVAYATFKTSNGTAAAELFVLGSGFGGSGFFAPNTSSVRGDGGQLAVYTLNSYPVVFGINGVESGRFGTDGSLLVGTTTNGGWAGTFKFEAKSALNAVSGYTTAGSGGNALYARVDNTSSNLVGFGYNGTQIGTITTNGSATAYNTTSDERLKDILPNQANYRAAIEDIWVGDFSWKKSKLRDFGIRAQQAYRLFPYAIAKPADPNGEWQADYGKLSPLALWGVKDLYKLVGKQEENVGKQSAIVKDLKERIASQSAEIVLLNRKLVSVEKRLNESLARN